MFTNYIKIAWRSLMRNKTYSAINILGLVISLTAFMLMALYIEHEFRYDQFNTKADRIYRVADDKQTPDLLLPSAASAAPVAPALLQDYPEVQQAARVIDAEALIKYQDKIFEERRIFISDASIFSIFSFNLLEGSAADALKDPMSIVLTEAVSKKYFGSEDAVGKVLLVDGKNMRVTGVLQNIPATSHLQFDFLISMATAQQKGSGYDWLFTNWYSNNFYTYVLLPENFDSRRLSSHLEDFDKHHRQPGDNTVHHYSLEKLTDIYLHSTRQDQAGPTGSLSNLYIFSIIALFILLLACINFINLSTARSAERAKEVAVRKVIGAQKQQMIFQFFTEALLTVVMSVLASIFLCYLLLPAFNQFTGKNLGLHLFNGVHISVLAALILVISVLSGGYPSFVLSGFKPVTALKGTIQSSGWNLAIRKGLVVMQFTISMVLIVSSIVVYRQMQFLQQHSLGFNPSQTMVINFEGDSHVKDKLETIKQQMLQVPGVQQVTASSSVPGDGKAGSWSMDFALKNGDTIHTELPIYLTDFSFLQQYDIPMIAGRELSQDFAADSVESMLINETALHTLGFRSPNDAIGVRVGMYPSDGVITGVFKDFHFKSLQTTIEPLAMRVLQGQFRVLSLKIDTKNLTQAIAGIDQQWKLLVPERPLEYSFLDESFNRQYQKEIRYKQVISLFTMLAIVVACLGLFGLALFNTQQRTREIGIRKVLGASVQSIAGLLSKDFVKLVLIAIVISTPVALWATTKWLQGFAYRISMNAWMFILAGAIALVIALLTVSFQAIKAAVANPVKSLRSE